MRNTKLCYIYPREKRKIMNNAICVRTCKGEYTPGEAVYGAVYLHVCSPTEANGIKISFKGVEKCHYQFGSRSKETLENEAVHADIHQTDLFLQKECFQFGSYVFPFCFEIPLDAPASFKFKGSSDKGSWAVAVSYWIHAFATGADAIQATQSLIVYQADQQALTERLFGCAQDATIEVPRFLLGSKQIHVIIKLIDNYVESGANMQLRIVVTNQTKVKVTGFHIKLLRYFRLFLRDMPDKQSLAENMEVFGGECQVAPEGGPHLVFSQGSSGSLMIGNAGLDRLQIPLNEKVDGQSFDLPPSVGGKHVKNHYNLEVSVNFDNNHVEVLTLTVPGVLPKKNQEWLRWKAPDWTYKAETRLSSSPFSVPKHKLRTVALAGLPTFQVL